MTAHAFTFCGAALRALPSGALYWPNRSLLIVSDLHLGKSARLAAQGGAQLPPYETRETLLRLEADLETTRARQVLCLGDSFDTDQIAAALPEAETEWILRLQAGRHWTWVEGNHDPGPIALPGTHAREVRLGPLVFRHIAAPDGRGEVSGHYHPKARLFARGRALSRPCFLLDANRLILPAYGAYTGGLRSDSPRLCALMAEDALAILTGSRAMAMPMPRSALV